jgi:hypothetical protein
MLASPFRLDNFHADAKTRLGLVIGHAKPIPLEGNDFSTPRLRVRSVAQLRRR